MKAATDINYEHTLYFAFQSTPPVKAATKLYCEIPACWIISIHAAREGGDDKKMYYEIGKALFQSTPPVKAATRNSATFSAMLLISIHAAREGGDFAYERKAKISFISIHAAREGGDKNKQRLKVINHYFNPRRP